LKKLLAIIFGLFLFYFVLLLADQSSSQGNDALSFLSPLYNALFRGANALSLFSAFCRPIFIPFSLIILLSTGIIPLIQKKSGRGRLLLLFSGLGIAVIGNIFLLNNSRIIGVIFYLTAMVMAGAASIFPFPSPPNADKPERKIFQIGLTLIIICSLLTGFYRITSIPAAVSGYEANSGLSAIQLIHNPLSNYTGILWPAMERSYSGSATSPFFVYFLAGLFKVSSINLLVLRSAGIRPRALPSIISSAR